MNNTAAINVNLRSQPGNWVTGTVTIDGGELKVQAKVYDEPSHYGINDGRISKLWITTADNTLLVNYDRGMDVNHLTDEGLTLIVEAIEAAVK